MPRIALRLFIAFYFLLPASVFAQSVDLLWQAHTYAPPFYAGRSLWTNESRITFTAIPHDIGVSKASLYFRWSKDGTVLGSSSGFGKDSLSFSDTVLSMRTEIKVDIMPDIGKGVLASASVSLKPTGPRLLVVEKNPLYGLMLHKAVGATFALPEEEVTFSAIPLFASVSARTVPVLTYTWTTNTGDSRTGHEVTYRAPEGTSGSSSVRLKAENSRILAQPPDKTFLIQFGNKNGF